MTKKEFEKAFKLADSPADLSNIDDCHLHGYGLKEFKPVCTDLKAVAKIMRWQAQYMNGNWDWKCLEELRQLGKTKFLIIG